MCASFSKKADMPFSVAQDFINVNQFGSNLFVRVAGSYVEIDITGRSILLPGSKKILKPRATIIDTLLAEDNLFDDHEINTAVLRQNSSDVIKQRYRTKVNTRAIRLLVNQNFNPNTAHMLTVTFRENLDYTTAEKHFKRLLKELQRKYIDMKFLSVIEPHDKGDYHMHVVINQRIPENIFEAKRLMDTGIIKSLKSALDILWPHGRFHQKPLNGGGNLGASLGYYLTKRVKNQDLEFKHSYRKSSNLERFQTLRGNDALQLIKEKLVEADIKEFYSYTCMNLDFIESLRHYEFCLDPTQALLYGLRADVLINESLVPAA
ncbi:MULTISPECIES: rolling circle replication-associated protein [Pelosinus]|uniref:Replication-associated protein ORF2/G2P domain-containing protein n=1 Tax=Pelosinus fermentans B4 TaxID=1149862 RepID=I9LAP2_9FIRM|nr:MULTISPECIES: hypothetical protein [Pelosinus]EIW17361.1 hypothetical protein FB4_4110 [Pelosinus fermentans B4]EIW23420.1 hypothetical protein FA11_4112 [Pelosinus fermentans A11]